MSSSSNMHESTAGSYIELRKNALRIALFAPNRWWEPIKKVSIRFFRLPNWHTHTHTHTHIHTHTHAHNIHKYIPRIFVSIPTQSDHAVSYSLCTLVQPQASMDHLMHISHTLNTSYIIHHTSHIIHHISHIHTHTYIIYHTHTSHTLHTYTSTYTCTHITYHTHTHITYHTHTHMYAHIIHIHTHTSHTYTPTSHTLHIHRTYITYHT